MWQRIQSLLAVTGIAVVIWLYAEARNIETYELSASVRFVGPKGADARVRPSSPVPVTLTFRCATAQYAAMRDDAETPLEIEVAPGDEAEVVTRTVDLTESLRRLLEPRGIDVREVRPSSAEVTIEYLETLSRPIVVVPGEAVLRNQPAIVPAEATLTVPARMQPLASQATVEARLDEVDLSRLEEGLQHTVTVPLRAPAGLGEVRISPSTAEVTLVLGAQTERLELASVPVWLLAPPSELANYDVLLDDADRVVRDVVLTGPASLLQRIDEDRSLVYAELRLSAADLDLGIEAATVTIRHPAGVAVEAPSPAPTIQVLIQREQAPAPSLP